MNTVSSLTKATNNASKATNSALNSLSVFATSTMPNALNSGLNSVTNFATKTVPNATVSALNSVSDFATNSVPNALNSVATKTVNSVAPIANSLMPFSTNSNKNSNKNANIFTNVSNSSANKNSSSTSFLSAWRFPIMIFLVLAAIATTVIVVFREQIEASYSHLAVEFRKIFGIKTADDITDPSEPAVTKPVDTPMDVSHANATKSKSIVEKILPLGTNEVFNVSSNDYTYYDAEPLCKALGAELATYDQLKNAWENGADWCNYGWTKGQVAVYPTQKDTWEKVQSGPEDERDACGQPGVNGGYFDNPEMRFGVNCYGKKPDQSTNDERVLMLNGSIPKTAQSLKIDKQINQYKAMADKLGVLPFNNDKWGSTV
jgi:hypothetical protein